MPSGNSFPKTVRLLKHADFEQVYKTGRRHFSSNLTVFFLRRGPKAQTKRDGRETGLEASEPRHADAAGQTSAPRVGFTVGRAMGPAVVRNRIRRRVREAVRQHLLLVAVPVDVVINPKKSALTAAFDDLADEVKRAFEKIEREQRKAGYLKC